MREQEIEIRAETKQITREEINIEGRVRVGETERCECITIWPVVKKKNCRVKHHCTLSQENKQH